MGMVLYAEDHIRTGPRSGAILSFRDLSTYVMGPNTEIILSTPPEKETKLQLVAGNLWVNVKKLMANGTMGITMNQAVGGIKGTILVCEQTATESILKVLEGEVVFTDRSGMSINVQSGEKISATSSGMGDVEFFSVDTEQAAWEELLALDSDSSNHGAEDAKCRSIFWEGD
jgi:hypothetical protein